MLEALATAAFLATLWLVGTVVARMWVDDQGKIAAALFGRSLLATAPLTTPVEVRISYRSRAQRALRATPQWRAAA